MKTLKDLNKIANKIGLELVKGEGYFYWWFLKIEDDLKYSGINLASIYVVHFNRMKFDKWVEELGIVKQALENEDKNIMR